MQLSIHKSIAGQPLIESHRGAELCGPENSWETIELAHQMGADLIEVDVQISADGVLFLRHNYTLPDGRWCRELDWDSLSRVKIQGQSLPKLDDVLDWASSNQVCLSLDLKGGFAIEDHFYSSVLGLLDRMAMSTQVLILDWNHKALQHIKLRNPQIAVRALARGNFIDLPAVLKSIPADAVSLSYDLITHKEVDQVRSMGISVALCEIWQPDFEYAMQFDIDILSWGNPKEAREAISLLGSKDSSLHSE